MPLAADGEAGEPVHIGGVELEGRRRGGHLAGDARPPTARRRRARGSAGWPAPGPERTKPGSTPRAKRYWASELMPVSRPVWAVRIGSNQALSTKTSVVASSTAGRLAAHDAAQADRRRSASAITQHRRASTVVGLAVRGLVEPASPVAAQARLDDAAGQLGRVIDVQRPAAVVGHQVGDIDQGADRAKADGAQPRCSQAGEGPFFTPRISRPANTGQASPSTRISIGHGNLPGTGATDGSFSAPDARGGQVAGDAGDAQPVGPVRRHLEVDHRFQAEGLGGGQCPPPARRPARGCRRPPRRPPAPRPSTACRWRPRRAPAAPPG